MLTESLTVLAAAGGSAVATAAGTDAWAGLRGRVAALLVDLEGVSLEALLSLDGDTLAEPMARLLRQIDDPQHYFADYNPSTSTGETPG